MEEKNYLIYISLIGENYKGDYEYEFLFSNNPDTVMHETWIDPCEGYVEPPDKNYISKVGRLRTKTIEFSLLTESSDFSMMDGIYKIIALGWEYIEDYKEFIESQDTPLVFNFGDSLEDVNNKLYERNLKLNFE